MATRSYAGGSPGSRPAESVLAALEAAGCNPRPSGSQWSARCPAHDDRSPSLSVGEGDDGRALVKCFAGCPFDQIVAALKLDPRDFFPDRDPGRAAPAGVTVTRLAFEKRLDAARLRAVFSLTDTTWKGGPAVGIPYRDATGADLFTRIRYHVVAKQGSWQPKGQPLAMYGLWRLKGHGERGGDLILVEGESDVWALDAHGFNALGLPGAEAAGAIDSVDEFAGFARVVVWRESDAAGKKFPGKVAARLRELGYPRPVYVASSGEGKDPADLQARWGAEFPARFRAVLDAAVPLGQEPAADSPEPQPDPPPIELVTRSAASIEPEEVDWLWPGYVPFAMISELVGDTGNAKSQIACYLAARLSVGLGFPGQILFGPAEPVRSLFLIAEDSASHTVVPRLIAAGADRSKVDILECVRAGTEEFGLVLPDHMHLVRELVERKGIRLIVLDPVSAFASGRTDTHTDASTRAGLMYPLGQLAKQTGAAVLNIRHLNKGSGKAAYRGNGSVAFTAAARVSLACGPDPDDPGRRVLAPIKCNIAAMPRSLSYTIEPVGSSSKVVWGEAVASTADDVLNPKGEPGRPNEAVAKAEEFLKRVLANGPVPAADVFAKGEAEGHSEKTLRRAKTKLGVVAGKSGFGGPWSWRLPEGGPEGGQGGRTQGNWPSSAECPENQGSTEDGQPSHAEDGQNPCGGPDDGHLGADPNAEERKALLLLILEKTGSMTAAELNRATGHAEDAIRDALRGFVEAGVVGLINGVYVYGPSVVRNGNLFGDGDGVSNADFLNSVGR